MNETIYNPQAFAEGEQKANELRKTIDALMEKQPSGYEFKTVGQEFRIYAPYNNTPSSGTWSWKREDSGKEYSYINIANLNEAILNEQLQKIASAIAEKENALGYSKKLQKLFPAPSETQKPEPAKLTPEQIKENKIRDIEKLIAEEVSATELAVTLKLSEQVKAHEDELAYLRKKLAVTQAGYELVKWDDDKYHSGELEKYIGVIPLFALEALQKAQTECTFDDFRVWTEREDNDPVLVGRIISNEHKTPYVIAKWS